MKSMVQGYEDAGAKYGVKVVTANTNNDQAKETELIQTYMAQGVSGHRHCSAEQGCLHRQPETGCRSKGIKVAITNMSISDTSFLAGGYTSDDATNGKIVGTNAAAKFIQDNLKGACEYRPGRLR